MKVKRPPSQATMAAALMAVALLSAACTEGDGASGEPSNATTVTASPNLVDDDGRSFAITEVGFGANGYVVLTNVTPSPASLATLYLCLAPACVPLPEVEVAPETTAVVAVGDGSGLENVVLPAAALDLQPADGEVGLYASDDVAVADDLRAYVQWGSTPHEGTATAIEAGLWLEGSYAPSTPQATRVYRSEDAAWRFE